MMAADGIALAVFLALLSGCWVPQADMDAAVDGKGEEGDADTARDTDVYLGPPPYEAERIEAQTFEMGCTAELVGESSTAMLSVIG